MSRHELSSSGFGRGANYSAGKFGRSDSPRGRSYQANGRTLSLNRHVSDRASKRSRYPAERSKVTMPGEQEENIVYHYYAFWKPYGVGVRFDGGNSSMSLGRYVQVGNVYPVGLMDSEAEGLLLLTDNPRFRYGLGHVKCREQRIFLAQVENIPTQEVFRCLKEGVLLNDLVAQGIDASIIEEPNIPERSVPIRERRNIPTCWLELDTIEGWTRHIRRVTAALGYPTLRLVQWAMGPCSLVDMEPGQLRELRPDELRWVDKVIDNAPSPRSREDMLRRSGKHFRQVRPEKARAEKGWACAKDNKRKEAARKRSAHAEYDEHTDYAEHAEYEEQREYRSSRRRYQDGRHADSGSSRFERESRFERDHQRRRGGDRRFGRSGRERLDKRSESEHRERSHFGGRKPEERIDPYRSAGAGNTSRPSRRPSSTRRPSGPRRSSSRPNPASSRSDVYIRTRRSPSDRWR